MSPRQQILIYKFGEFRLNADEHLLLRGNERVSLSPRTFSLLVKLVENSGHLLAKETLMKEVWADSVVEEGNLNRTISNLRKALGEKPNEDRFIQTVPRIGYRFIAPVTQSVEPVNPTREFAPEASNGKPESTVLPAPDSQLPRNRRLGVLAMLGVIGSLILVGGGFVVWRVKRGEATHKPLVAESGEPIRLTDSPFDDFMPHWTKDGRIRFYHTDANHQISSYVMNADGSSQSVVHDFPSLGIGLWSPDAQKVIVIKPNDRSSAYLVNADGSNETALPFISGNYDWSFDSKHIVYQKTIEPNNAEVFVYSTETKESRNITNHPGFDADPSFSPDGKQVVFVSSRDGNNELYLTSVDGSRVKRLTNHASEDSHPVFSPDGTAIAFTSDRGNESADVYLLTKFDGSDGALRLTDWKSNETVEPGCWSFDGTKIAFFSDRNGKDDIYVVSGEALKPRLVRSDSSRNLSSASYSPDGKRIVYKAESADKSGDIEIFDAASNRSNTVVKVDELDGSPVWSPDNEWIAFQKQVNGNNEICLVKTDGSGFTNLTNNPAKDVTPAWSPDGKQIAFVSNRDGPTTLYQIYLMNADGTNQHRIYYSSGFSSAPSWSPDGREILFANDKEDGRTGNFEIFTIEPETSESEKRLTFRPRYDVSPTFSPDGKRIVFVSDRDGNSEIYVMNSDGTGITRVTRNSADDQGPRWSPDGKRILFSSNRNGRFEIFELEVN